jgi:two-component system CheB/CheR fusion protein
LVVLATTGGLLLSLTKARKYEGAGASKIGSVFIYILVATIGMKMELEEAVKEPQLILVGLIWMTVHVIDDDPMILETMRRLFEAEGLLVATYLSAEDFLELPRPDAPACLLVDNLLPGMDGVALINLLRAENSQLPVIVLTGHGDATIAVAAMKAGAADFIEKPASAAELLASVRIALKSGKSTGQMQKRPSSAAQTRFAALTARERDVLTRVLQGTPNKIIAADLGINQRTVENHRAAVMRKTEAASLPDLVRLALLAGVQSL